MQTSLQSIAKKASEQKLYRFRNLYGMLNEKNLMDSWKYMNQKSAPGVDKQTAKEYEENLEANIRDLNERLKRNGYHAKLVKRVYIPKANGKMRPLGLPATEDKLLQVCAARILNAIYEQDFLKCSYGYRMSVGAKDAIKSVSAALQFGNYNYVVEADIKGFFDNISHEWLIKMLELRIDDKAFIRLIKKWLKAGILDMDGKVIHPATGTPQGGIVSPILANIYLHYALDIWFEKIVKERSRGKAYICRYADDFICAFENKEDAETFYQQLGTRLEKFWLMLAADKTRIIRFSRHEDKNKESFEFLGFEFRWGKDRNGKPKVERRTSRKKLKLSLLNLKNWCRKMRSTKLDALFKLLNAKLRGYYNYYGVIGNYRSLAEFFYQAERILFKWLNRRSQRKSFNWKGFAKMCKKYGMLRPMITEKKDLQLKLKIT